MTTAELQRPFTAASHEAYLAEHKLMASRCSVCGAIFVPARAICPHCHTDNLVWQELSGSAKLAGFTVVYVAPSAMLAQGFNREKPYIAGIVELAEGPKISARITGIDVAHPETIQIGTAVTAEYLEVSLGETRKVYLAFKPV